MSEQTPKPEQYRLTIAKSNKQYIIDLSKYLDQRPTETLNMILTYLKVENPPDFIDYLKKRHVQPQNESPITALKTALEEKTTEAATTIKDNLKRDLTPKSKPTYRTKQNNPETINI